MSIKKIIRNLRRYTWVFLLWMIFTLGCICAPFLALAFAFPCFKRKRYIRNFVLAADRMCAAMLGYPGRVTLSTECIHSANWLYLILNEIEENHCEDSAFVEGAYCRLSDHQLGEK